MQHQLHLDPGAKHILVNHNHYWKFNSILKLPNSRNYTAKCKDTEVWIFHYMASSAALIAGINYPSYIFPEKFNSREINKKKTKISFWKQTRVIRVHLIDTEAISFGVSSVTILNKVKTTQRPAKFEGVYQIHNYILCISFDSVIHIFKTLKLYLVTNNFLDIR